MGFIRERKTWPSFPYTTWEELEKVTGIFWKKICDSPNCSAGLQLHHQTGERTSLWPPGRAQAAPALPAPKAGLT